MSVLDGNRHVRFLDQYPMLIFALEAFVALALLIFIVVWTSSGRKKHTRKPR